MSTLSRLTFACLLSGCFSAFAQQATPVNPANGQPLTPQQIQAQGLNGVQPSSNALKRDCLTAKNPERCQARQEKKAKAKEACKGVKGSERKACMKSQMNKAA